MSTNIKRLGAKQLLPVYRSSLITCNHFNDMGIKSCTAPTLFKRTKTRFRWLLDLTTLIGPFTVYHRVCNSAYTFCDWFCFSIQLKKFRLFILSNS